MRGISDLQLISDDKLETEVILPQMVLNNVGSALNDSNFSSQTIIQIMGDSKNRSDQYTQNARRQRGENF